MRYTERGRMYTGGALIVVCTVLALFQIPKYFQYQDLVKSGDAVETTATVYDYDVDYRSTSGSRRKDCDAWYEYEVDGRRYTGLSDRCFSGGVGSTLTIYYDKNDPSNDFEISDTSVMITFLPVLGVLFGIGLIIYEKKFAY